MTSQVRAIVGAIEEEIVNLKVELDQHEVEQAINPVTVLAQQLTGLYLPVLRMMAVFHGLAQPEDQHTKENYALRLATYLIQDGYKGQKERR